MLSIGYTLSSEEHSPNELVKNAQMAEDAGFAFAMISDHYHPWIDAQGNSPLAWTVIGGIAHATRTIKLGTGVTCPILRYHPAIIAQGAATAQEMMEGRFFLGVGTGEHLNEHVVGRSWPPINVRQEMLAEAIWIMRLLWKGDYQTYWGKFFNLDDGRIYTMPQNSIPIVVAASASVSATLAGEVGDGLVSTAPNKKLVKKFEDAGGKNKPKYAQFHLCYDKSVQNAKKIVTKIWPNSALPSPLNTELRIPKYFENAVSVLSDDQIVSNVPLGPSPEPILQKIQDYADAGFDNIYLHQIGPYQKEFIEFAQKEILPKFKTTSKTTSDTKVKLPKTRQPGEFYPPQSYPHRIRKK